MNENVRRTGPSGRGKKRGRGWWRTGRDSEARRPSASSRQSNSRIGTTLTSFETFTKAATSSVRTPKTPSRPCLIRCLPILIPWANRCSCQRIRKGMHLLCLEDGKKRVVMAVLEVQNPWRDRLPCLIRRMWRTFLQKCYLEDNILHRGSTLLAPKAVPAPSTIWN